VEVLQLIREKSHFRDGTKYKDNYYVADARLRWFLCFCHHDGWHLWLPNGTVQKPAWRRWRRQTGARWVHPASVFQSGARPHASA
jgi:hypothetical protein